MSIKDSKDFLPTLKAFFDGIFEGVQVIDFDLRYVYLNKTAIQHARKELHELVGKSMAQMYPGIEQTEIYTLIQRCLKDRSHQQMVNHFSYPDGKQAWFDLRVSPLPIGALVLSMDISEQKAAEEQLRRHREELAAKQRMESMGMLAGGVAHDFNNLLTVITGYAGLALESLKPDDPLRADLLHIRDAGDRAAALTRQLLAFSRKQVLQPRTLDLNQVVEGMARMLKRIIGEDIELAVSLKAGLDPVLFDPGQIEQIIMNLAVNARDAMPHGGKLNIETANIELGPDYVSRHLGTKPGPHVMLAVTDNGTGMDAATRERVFEPFFTTKQLGHGTGMGLSMVHGIVKQSGGDIWVYSEPGKGSCFKVYLPRAAAEAQPEPASPRQPLRSQGGGVTVLLVEDEEGVRSLMSQVLTRAGYQVLGAGDAKEALELCKSHPGAIQLLLSDVVLPGIGGRALADQVLILRPGIRVVFMSGYTDNAIVHHGVLDPGTAFIEKPVAPAALLEKLKGFLE